MTGEIIDVAGLTGNISDTESISCSLSSAGSLCGHISVPTIISPEYYEGAYEITPSDSMVTLDTSDLYMRENVVINPIPPNYGLITWDGTKITVS